jgi:adenosylcobinamide-GDP ribazoletransferase
MRALISFFTILPGGAPGTLEDAARSVHLLPLVGLYAGLPGAALLLLAGNILPPGLAATLALVAVLLAQGLHHADGVLDVGDALMVRGSPERRREVLKDARVGIGGLGALFVVYGPTLAALVSLAGGSPLRAALALLSAEAAARSGMLFVLLLGRPATEGSSAAPFARTLGDRRRRTTAFVLALTVPPLVALPLGPAALVAALVAAPLVGLLSVGVSHRAFGGIVGDSTGAAGELTRAALLVSFSILV